MSKLPRYWGNGAKLGQASPKVQIRRDMVVVRKEVGRASCGRGLLGCHGQGGM